MKLFTLKAIAPLLISLLLNGCGTTFVSGNISTIIDPSFVARTNAHVVVAPKDFNAVYYLPVLKEALEARGFESVTISRSAQISYHYDALVTLDVGRQTSEKTETVKDYGIVGTSITPGDFKCKQTNNGLTGKRTRCRSGETKIENTYGTTGTREVTTNSLSRSISLSFSVLPDNQTVVSAVGTSDEPDWNCSNAGIYKFLIIHTVKRLDFGTPRNHDYTVQLPEGYDCESSLEYERSLRDGVSTGQVASNTQTHAPQTKIDNSSVTGCVDGDCVNGQGTYIWASGDKYVGQYKDGKTNGQGTFTFSNGIKYVGQWKDGKRNGQGTSTYPNGDKYVGHYKDDKRNGQGTYTFANGHKYVGQHKDGKTNGQGTFTYPNGNKYVGHYEDGKRNGQGTYTFANGRKQEGQWIVGEFDEASLGDSLKKKSVLERADDYKTGLIQVKLNSSTEYSCMYVHDRIWVALNVFQVPRRVCPKYVDWPAKDSTKIFDMTQTGTNLNAGASLKLNKGSSNSNVCAYSVLYSEADLLIPKGSGAVCPQKYGF